MQSLRQNEFAESLVADIRQFLIEVLGPRDLKQPKLVRERTIEYLTRRIPIARGIDMLNGDKTKLVALVGPTGVGKTTTLAKLATGLALDQSKQVAFITQDTFRIAAPEQLKKYAEIVSVPAKVVFQPEEMIQIVQGLKQKNVIFIDTVGRSPRCRSDLLDLKRFLDFGMPVETHLLLSATTKLSDLQAIMTGFQELNYRKIIVTKLDETNTFGPILSALAEQKGGVSFVTDGQTVPDDIAQADALKLAGLAFGRRTVALDGKRPNAAELLAG